LIQYRKIPLSYTNICWNQRIFIKWSNDKFVLLSVNAKRLCKSVLYGGECLASRPAHLIPLETALAPTEYRDGWGRKLVWVPWRKPTYPLSRESNIQMYSNYCNEIFALLWCYAANSRSLLPTFRDNLSVPSSSVKQILTLEGGLSRNVRNELPIYVAWHPRRARSHLYRGGSLKWLTVVIFLTRVVNMTFCKYWAF